MSTSSSFRIICLSAIALSNVAFADIQSFVVAKGQLLRQTNAANPVAEAPAFSFFATVIGEATNAAIRLPSNAIKPMEASEGPWEFNRQFSTAAQLDTAFPSGRYGFIIDTEDNGRLTPSISLPAGSYPNAPRILNWNDLQQVEASHPLTINWASFAGGRTNDFIMLQVYNGEDTGDPLFSSPTWLEEGAMNGTNTSFTIPADALESDQSYIARLLFARRVAFNTTNPPGVIGFSTYYRETAFPISTLPAATDPSRIQFNASGYSAAENAGSLRVVVTRSGTGAATAQLTMTAGTTSQFDLETFSSADLSFAEDEMEKEIYIELFDDVVREGNETFQLHLTAISGVLGPRSTATVTIIDDELAGAGAFQIMPNRYKVSETNRVVKVTFSRVGGTNGPSTLTFQTLPVTATENVDYIGTNGVLHFAHGQVSKVVPIRILDDAYDEPNEMFDVIISQKTGGAAITTNSVARVTIVDNDAGGVLAFSRNAFTVNEGGNSALITVNRTGGRADGVTVQYATTNLTATPDLDYTPTSGLLSFGSNQVSKTFSIPIQQDSLAEGNETIGLQLSEPLGGATLGPISVATLTIRDDETTVSLKAPTITVSETNRAAAVVVTRSGPLNQTVSVQFTTSNGSATSPGDYRGTNGTLTFGPNVSTKTILIPIINDAVVESAETFTFSLSNPTGGAELGTVSSSVITINNDDFPGTITFSATHYSGQEGNAIAVTIKRLGGKASGVTVNFTASAGTATAGTDFKAVSSTLTFAAGETSKTVRISTTLDPVPEGNETVQLTLSAPTGGATLGATPNSVLTIANRPDPNAISGSGTPFLNVTVSGLNGNPLSKSMYITHNPGAQEVVAASYVTGGLIQGLTGSKTTVTLNGWTPITTTHTFQIPTMTVNGPGIYPIYANGSTGGAVWTYLKFGGESHTYGTGKTGASGTIIIDVLDAGSNTIAGRFDLVMVQTDGNKKARVKGSFRVKNVSGL